MNHESNPASAYLLALARQIAAPYIALSKTRAVLVSGSTAEGQSDFYSDLDMSIYYDELPSDEELDAARRQYEGSERLWGMGDRAQEGFIEAYLVRGIECQIGHITVTAWEHEMAVVLEQLDVASPLQKALEGTLHGIPLYGETLIRQWQARAADYPDALAEAMVKHYLSFFPIWYLQERFATRDATLWRYQIFVEAAQNILGILAGLNRQYYSTFQFKRMRHFLAKLAIAPPNIADRLEAIFTLERAAAIAQLETLVEETVTLVEQHMPQVATAPVRKRLGQRQQAWSPESG